MTQVNPLPTPEEIRDGWDGRFLLVHKDLDDHWRHGNYVTGIFEDLELKTFWSLSWQESGDGEYNTLRDEPDLMEPPVEVERYERTVYDYRMKNNER